MSRRHNYPKNRKPPRVIMHICDITVINGEDFITFECRRCDAFTKKFPLRTITEVKRGKPCPNCNVKKPAKEDPFQLLWDEINKGNVSKPLD
jgi:hypothetical protein